MGGALSGLFFAALGLLIGAVRIGLALLAGRRFPFGARDALVLISYPVGFVIAGSVVGALYPIRRRLIGALLLGVVGAALFWGTMLLAMKGNPVAWNRKDWLLLAGLSVAVGSIFGFLFRKDR